jgi:hypothetical protein
MGQCRVKTYRGCQGQVGGKKRRMRVRNYLQDSYLCISAHFFLVFSGAVLYNKGVMGNGAAEVGYGLRRSVMLSFYYKVWLPFAATKKRVLILAIAAYIALC